MSIAQVSGGDLQRDLEFRIAIAYRAGAYLELRIAIAYRAGAYLEQ